jgi:hypothetical protein
MELVLAKRFALPSRRLLRAASSAATSASRPPRRTLVRFDPLAAVRMLSTADADAVLLSMPGALSARKFPGRKPTLEEAIAMKRDYHEFSKDTLLLRSAAGDHQADKERCVQRIFPARCAPL